MIVKDLMENEDLALYITEDFEELVEEDKADSEVWYEVWAIGYAEDDTITDAELLIETFDDPYKAVEKAKSLTFSDIIQLAADDDSVAPDEPVAYVSIEVETVVEDEYDSTMNVGTIFKSKLYVEEEDDIDTIIHLKDGDYTLSDDEGNLIISCAQFNHLNKNDIIKVMYDDEDGTPILTYTVMSKTTSGNFECEFMY